MITPATLISILPYDLREEKPSSPGSFVIPAVEKGDVGVLVIENASAPYYVDHARGSIRMQGDPELVAKSVVDDHLRATIHVSLDAHPGLAYVPGAKTKEQVKKECVDLLKDLEKKQNKWFEKLVRVADDTWQRYRRHNVISDQHRLAAGRLGLKREWADILSPTETIECTYCRTLISSKAIVCAQCRMPQEAAIALLPEKAQSAVRSALKV